MVGPTVKGLAGSQIELSDGRSVTADDAYPAKAITDPDAELVKGYQKGVMSASISSFGLAERPQDVEALVAFIKAQASAGCPADPARTTGARHLPATGQQ